MRLKLELERKLSYIIHFVVFTIWKGYIFAIKIKCLIIVTKMIVIIDSFDTLL